MCIYICIFSISAFIEFQLHLICKMCFWGVFVLTFYYIWNLLYSILQSPEKSALIPVNEANYKNYLRM